MDDLSFAHHNKSAVTNICRVNSGILTIQNQYTRRATAYFPKEKKEKFWFNDRKPMQLTLITITIYSVYSNWMEVCS